MAQTIPVVVFITKIGVNVTFQFAYQTTYTDDKVFPFYKRATAIGIVNFIARSLTILSSLAAELPRPWPASLLIGVNVIALITACFLPTPK